MVEYKEFPETKIAEIIIDGNITEQDFDRIAPQIKSFIDSHGTIKLIEIIKRLGKFEFGMVAKGIKFDIKHMSSFSHCAVVSDSGWIGPFARTISPLLSIEIKTFRLDEENDARLWLENPEVT